MWGICQLSNTFQNFTRYYIMIISLNCRYGIRKDNFRERTSAVIFRECIAQPDYVLIQITIGIHARIVLYFNSFVLPDCFVFQQLCIKFA